MKSAQGPSPNQDLHKPGQMCGSQNKSLFMYFFISIFLKGKKFPFSQSHFHLDFRSLSHKRNPDRPSWPILEGLQITLLLPEPGVKVRS